MEAAAITLKDRMVKLCRTTWGSRHEEAPPKDKRHEGTLESMEGGTGRRGGGPLFPEELRKHRSYVDGDGATGVGEVRKNHS